MITFSNCRIMASLFPQNTGDIDTCSLIYFAFHQHFTSFNCNIGLQQLQYDTTAAHQQGNMYILKSKCGHIFSLTQYTAEYINVLNTEICWRQSFARPTVFWTFFLFYHYKPWSLLYITRHMNSYNIKLTSSLSNIRPSNGRDMDHWFLQSSNMMIFNTVDNI